MRIGPSFSCRFGHAHVRILAMSSITAPSSTGISTLDSASLEAQEFVARQGLLADLRETLVMASDAFDLSEPIALSVEEDPDTGEKWMEMNVAARGSVEEVMAAHESFMDRQLALQPTSALQIRLFLHIARE